MNWLFILLILFGTGCLAASLSSLRSILNMLGEGPLRQRWQWLHKLAVLFTVSYPIFAAIHIGLATTGADIFVGIILALMGLAALLVSRLSAMTTKDLVRIASLERDVMRDPLTGLLNRRYLDSRLDEEIERARRSGLPLSLLMIDLDHFKHINDSYGHLVGDQVLRHVSSLVVSVVRVSDMVVRYGGEEFLVIAPDSALEDATHLGDRLLHHLRNYEVPLPNGEPLKVTASIGAASLHADDNQVNFLRRADVALYDAKGQGRDRLCIAQIEAIPRPI